DSRRRETVTASHRLFWIAWRMISGDGYPAVPKIKREPRSFPASCHISTSLHGRNDFQSIARLQLHFVKGKPRHKFLINRDSHPARVDAENPQGFLNRCRFGKFNRFAIGV